MRLHCDRDQLRYFSARLRWMYILGIGLDELYVSTQLYLVSDFAIWHYRLWAQSWLVPRLSLHGSSCGSADLSVPAMSVGDRED